MNEFIILDKSENGSILVNSNNIVTYISGGKADKVFIVNEYETYKKYSAFTLKKNLYIVDNILNQSPFIKLNIKDVDLPCYINICCKCFWTCNCFITCFMNNCCI